MLRWCAADLHVHTCLSPCGDLRMSPRRIVAEAEHQHLDIVAVTDHNAAENIAAVMRAAQGRPVVVLPGMEVCTAEEAHILAIFEKLDAALALQAVVQKHLHGKNDPEVFGLQVIANEHDEVEGFVDQLLIGATALSIDTVVATIHELGGLAVAAHIDRESFSIISQLGFIPAALAFDALEISSMTATDMARKRFKEYQQTAFIRNSDAHDVDHLGRNVTRYLLEEPTFVELTKALHGRDGRRAAMD